MLGVPDEVAFAIAGSRRTFGPIDGETIDAPASIILAGAQQNFDVNSLWEFVPRAKVERLPGTGHFLMMEKPQEFNARLREFLEGIEF